MLASPSLREDLDHHYIVGPLEPQSRILGNQLTGSVPGQDVEEVPLRDTVFGKDGPWTLLLMRASCSTERPSLTSIRTSGMELFRWFVLTY